jgi:uncharacterized phage-associated protein
MSSTTQIDNKKLENTICFFAQEHKKHAGRTLSQTALYKYLAFLDFWAIETTGKPSLNLTYLALKRGPVPNELYGALEQIQSNLFKIKTGLNPRSLFVISTQKPDLDEFSPNELTEMRRLVKIFANPSVSTAQMCEASHEKILAWQRVYKSTPKSLIDFKFNFKDDIDKKKLEDLSPIEENFLIFRSLNSIRTNL